jgi:hypothetical protein
MSPLNLEILFFSSCVAKGRRSSCRSPRSFVHQRPDEYEDQSSARLLGILLSSQSPIFPPMKLSSSLGHDPFIFAPYSMSKHNREQ